MPGANARRSAQARIGGGRPSRYPKQISAAPGRVASPSSRSATTPRPWLSSSSVLHDQPHLTQFLRRPGRRDDRADAGRPHPAGRDPPRQGALRVRLRLVRASPSSPSSRPSVFGGDWGSPLSAGTVVVAMVIAVVCLTALVIGVARTQRQAEGISSACRVRAGPAGGQLRLRLAEPAVMRRIASFTPNGGRDGPSLIFPPPEADSTTVADSGARPFSGSARWRALLAALLARRAVRA